MYRQSRNEVINNAIKQVQRTTEEILDSGATSNFIQSADGFKLTCPSSKIVTTNNKRIMQATMTALSPLTQLKAGACKLIVVPDI